MNIRLITNAVPVLAVPVVIAGIAAPLTLRIGTPETLNLPGVELLDPVPRIDLPSRMLPQDVRLPNRIPSQPAVFPVLAANRMGAWDPMAHEMPDAYAKKGIEGDKVQSSLPRLERAVQSIAMDGEPEDVATRLYDTGEVIVDPVPALPVDMRIGSGSDIPVQEQRELSARDLRRLRALILKRKQNTNDQEKL